MLGLMLENGPLHIAADGSLVPNNFSWDKLVDYVWVDQPVYVILRLKLTCAMTHDPIRQWNGVLDGRIRWWIQ